MQESAAEKVVHTERIQDFQVGERVSVAVSNFEGGPLDQKTVLGTAI